MGISARKTVAILDYGSGNLHSVAKALEQVAGRDYAVLVSGDRNAVLAAERIVFPGQGAIGQCMQTLIDKGFPALLKECLLNKPFLGICLGLQTLMDASEEDGGTDGLALIPGRVRRFPAAARDTNGDPYKIPHMGWNKVKQAAAHPLWKNIKDGERFYFVHSYYVQPDHTADAAGVTDYIVSFTSAAARDNLFATQFHPEKSQKPGLALLRNFLDWQP
ncbi:MAG: imidazole glycerol phosphate synthase subunit HisH [Gammaproteobacteria bacterium]|nr:imidazole glycerol phosphate synthase subunit HisH [Gammaproteobacteria bacterium]